ncbi:MAG: cytidine deaminase [Chthoniobacterales bacterium]
MGAQIDWQALIDRARAARKNAHAPYSSFLVGAALATESGEIFTGANVENASFGLTICAERVAASTAVAAGFRKFTAIALVTDTKEPVLPCGACRQFLAEFGVALQIHCAACDGLGSTFLLSDLLPSAFIDFRGA